MDNQAGLVFATICMRKKQSASWDVNAFRDKFKEASAESHHCWMWYDPKADSKYIWPEDCHFHPGLAIFVKMV